MKIRRRLATDGDLMAAHAASFTVLAQHGEAVMESCEVVRDTAVLGIRAIALIHRITLLGLAKCEHECDEILDDAGISDYF